VLSSPDTSVDFTVYQYSGRVESEEYIEYYIKNIIKYYIKNKYYIIKSIINIIKNIYKKYLKF